MPVHDGCVHCRVRPCTEHVNGFEIETVDELWVFVYNWLQYRLTGPERARGTRTLIRRLRHPEAGRNGAVGLKLGDEEIARHHWTARGRMVKPPPVLCVCGAPRYLHDEEGAYDPNACNEYIPA